MIQTPGEMEAIMVEKLPQETGEPLSFWLEKIKTSGTEAKTAKIANFLKSEFNFKHGYAYVTAQIFLNNGQLVYGNPDELLNLQFKNEKELKELYFELIKHIENKVNFPIKFGVCKGYVSILGSKQIGVIIRKKNELIVGLALKNTPFSDYLKPVKNLGGSDKITHQIMIKSTKSLNALLIDNLTLANQLN